MAMAAGAAAGSATKLITALNSAKTVKATGNLVKTVGGINDAQESGALDSLKEIFSNIQSTGPFLSIAKIIMATITAGTADTTMELFKEVMELLESPEGKEGMDRIIDFLNAILEIGILIVGTTNDINENAGPFGEFLQRIVGFLRTMNDLNPITALIDLERWAIALIKALRALFDVLDDLKAKLEEIGENWQNPMEDQRPGSGPTLF